MKDADGLAVLIPRILFGLMFFAFGIMGLFNLGEQPEGTPEGNAFVGAMKETGYLFEMVKITEIVCGVVILSGFFVPLALVVMTPIVINITAFHVFLDPSGQGIGVTVVMSVLFLMLTYKHWYAYRVVLQAKPSREG